MSAMVSVSFSPAMISSGKFSSGAWQRFCMEQPVKKSPTRNMDKKIFISFIVSSI